MHQAALATLPCGQLLIEIFEVVTVSQVEHLAGKTRPILPTRVANHYFDVIVCVAIDELGDMLRMRRLIQDIATDHIVELAKLLVLGFPVTGLILDRRQTVTEYIFIQKTLGAGMIVAGRDIDAHAM